MNFPILNFPICDYGSFKRRSSDGRNILIIGTGGKWGYAFDVNEAAPPAIPLSLSWPELLAAIAPDCAAIQFSATSLNVAGFEALRSLPEA